MSLRYWLNLEGEPIEPSGDVRLYSLDTGEYLEENFPKFQDLQRGVCSATKENFYLFYLMNGINPPSPNFITTNIEDIPVEELYRLSEFNLMGLITKGRVVSLATIHNGSLYLEVAFFVPVTFTSSYYIEELRHKKKLSRRIIPYFGDSGFFMRRTCRLIGVRTPPSGSPEATVLTEFLTGTCNELRNMLYLRFSSEDDRAAHFYSSPSYKQNIATYLLEYNHPEMGTIAYPE